MTATIENFPIEGPAGQLEGLLNIPDGNPRRVAVMCHPHPQFGATMHNNVIYNVARALRERSVAVLRFNFRGVGRSEGSYDMGRGEQDDVRAAVDALLVRFPGRACWLGGFSFGSWVGLRVGSRDPRVQALLGVGMPVNGSDFSYLEACVKPLAAIHGGGDPHGDESVLRLLFNALRCPKHLEVIAEAGHFFAQRLHELRAAVGRAADFLEAEEARA